MAKTSYAVIQGKLVEKTGDNTAIINGELWQRISGRWFPPGLASCGRAPYIQPDITPYQSMQTGEMIQGRSQHRAHLRQHNLIEVGNEKLPPPKQEWTATEGLRQELITRLDQMR